jgi:hypothetical protein
MNELSEVLKGATSNIVQGYFRLQIDGGDPIYRERVYCYELYHQMRQRWPATTPYYLNGEIDKAAHPILRDLGADTKKPDLLVHQPGYMAGNYAVIEVKSSDAGAAGIRKDLASLSLFRTTVGYQRAMYLIYGEHADRVLEQIVTISGMLQNIPPIEIWLHGRAEQPATHAMTLQI